MEMFKFQEGAWIRSQGEMLNSDIYSAFRENVETTFKNFDRHGSYVQQR